MYISGSFSKTALLLLFLSLLGKVSAQEVAGQEVSKKDTLRTFGPRFGVDLAPFIYYFTEPKIIGAEVSMDFEMETFDYESLGNYARVGVDYNLLKAKDRAWHNTMTVGIRYGMSFFKQNSDNVLISSDYWGDYRPDPYESNLKAHWLELTGGIKVEIVPNLYMGWLLRFKFLLNPDMDPVMIPALIPGYGNGADVRTFGFSYSVFYMIPLIKK